MTHARRWFGLLLCFVISMGVLATLTLQQQPAPLSQPANFLAADKGYGVTVDLTRYDDADLAAALADLRANGLLWLRQPVRWAELESAPGQFRWQALDRVLAAVAQANQVDDDGLPFKLIAVLQSAPRWARPPDLSATAPPRNLADFGRFSRALASRYRGQIAAYQIWDEPNLHTGWGRAFIEPEAYARLLREAALNIRTADPQAVIVLAALAPTLERNRLNLAEAQFLAQLYQAGAAPWFDVVAVQPYGFDSEPVEPAQADVLNFRRAELVRQVMLVHNDASTPVWATAFGWNALPADWTGPKSPWKSAPPEQQARRTAQAIRQARRDWPWLGPLLAVRWSAADLPADDPARGFALRDTPPLLAAIRQAATAAALAGSGRYPAPHPSGQFSPAWRTAQTRADIPPHSSGAPPTLTLSFSGTHLALDIERGPYRGYLWVTVDGQPASALPRDSQGRSYVVLYDPLRQREQVTLARDLPPGRHQAVIRAEGGWGQWAITGWTVAHAPEDSAGQPGIYLAALLAGLSGLGLVWYTRRTPHAPGAALGFVGAGWRSLAARYALLGWPSAMAITLGLGLALYLSEGWLQPGLLLPFALALLLWPETGLVGVAFGLSFVSVHQPLFLLPLSLLEVTLLATGGGLLRRRLSPPTLIDLDWAALALLGLGLLSTLFAANFGVSMHAWRTVLLASVMFYGLVRLGLRSNSGLIWRLVDAFAAGAVLQAGLAVALYGWGISQVPAEGVYRAVGAVYVSPNHLALFLGRAWPLLLAVAALPGQPRSRRLGYALGWLIVSVALFLTFSRGWLLLGLPATLLTMALLVGARRQNWQWGRLALLAGCSIFLLLLLALLGPLLQTPRFLSLLAFEPGSTIFARLKLWQASLTMLGDHWLLGVGLDNFLYQYRTRYILPQAWQEPNLSHPHNWILDFGVRLGVGGIVLLLWLQVAFWRRVWRRYAAGASPLLVGLMGSMAAFLSHGLADNSFFLIDLALAFFLVVGLVAHQPEAPDSSASKA